MLSHIAPCDFQRVSRLTGHRCSCLYNESLKLIEWLSTADGLTREKDREALVGNVLVSFVGSLGTASVSLVLFFGSR